MKFGKLRIHTGFMFWYLNVCYRFTMNESNKGLDHIKATATVDVLLAPKLLKVENWEPD